jgi:uncharacterized protein (TIGR00299 family) protein
MIRAADLPETVIEWATAVYSRLAEVEGAIHGIDPDEVELHEVGADDSIVDVVGVCAALHALGVDRVCHGPIAVGHGTVETRHGTLANPVPAVSELLAASRSPVIGVDTTMELSTPTGVALITVLAEVTGGSSGPMPDMTVTASGFGAGTADTPGRPNVVQAVVGEELTSGGAHSADRTGRAAIVIETNVDDVTPEVLAYTIERLLEAGAHDAWITPIVMKKGRPAHTVHALCDESVRDRVAEVLISETGTLGVRAHHVERWPQPRDEITVTIVIDGAEHDLQREVAARWNRIGWRRASGRRRVQRRCPHRASDRPTGPRDSRNGRTRRPRLSTHVSASATRAAAPPIRGPARHHPSHQRGLAHKRPTPDAPPQDRRSTRGLAAGAQ